MPKREELKKSLIDENEYRSNKRRMSSKEGDIHIIRYPPPTKNKRGVHDVSFSAMNWNRQLNQHAGSFWPYTVRLEPWTLYLGFIYKLMVVPFSW
jgi:hypothetical protein